MTEPLPLHSLEGHKIAKVFAGEHDCGGYTRIVLVTPEGLEAEFRAVNVGGEIFIEAEIAQSDPCCPPSTGDKY